MKQEMTEWQWHQLDHMQIIYTLLQTDNHASSSSLNFYRSQTFPDTQPTVSKHEGRSSLDWSTLQENCFS